LQVDAFMKRNPTNFRLVNADTFVPDSRYAKMCLEAFGGKLVKVRFQSADSRPETMWVRVTGVDQHQLVGTLDNEPVDVTHLKLGDIVHVWRTEIIMIQLTRAEWIREAKKLRAQDDYFNKWLGKPLGKAFNRKYELGISPQLALRLWRNYVPNHDID
jgi:hypothetical protein